MSLLWLSNGPRQGQTEPGLSRWVLGVSFEARERIIYLAGCLFFAILLRIFIAVNLDPDRSLFLSEEEVNLGNQKHFLFCLGMRNRY